MRRAREGTALPETLLPLRGKPVELRYLEERLDKGGGDVYDI